MSLQRLMQQSCNGNLVDYSAGPAYNSYSPLTGSFRMDDNRRIQMLADTVATLPRGRKQLALTRSSSLGDFSWSQRKLITVEKQDNGTFGFEIQTYRLQNQNLGSSEMCTLICKIQEDSPAHYAGLQTGDVLANINGVNTEGFTHKQVVDLIRSSGNLLTIETLNGTMILKRAELEAKLQVLKQTLKKKWVEFRSLQLQEQRLLHGDTGNCPSLENMDIDESVLFGTLPGPGPALLDRNRLSSESSCLSSMTMDSEDGYQTCVSEDSSRGGFSRQTSTDDECFVPKDGDDFLKRSSSRRNRSVSTASSGSMSPLWEGNFSNMFGTLPRKSRRGSVRKQLLKFIPGLHRAVEEEESRF
ncbi:cytohesin-interacting protein isoform X2 [Zalophus californianus]|uniref:Cytohesin-interacting protein n=1 Tax=Zalophus californianus TaxID=9704 RepID=A0A6J2CPS2_ZALCA|nr:cytohesin-interacting protein isoform X2 [Zalophus californianus]XP_027968829.1 cytohesin-interacting protein isoform X2 [Eumetopias jubatus]